MKKALLPITTLILATAALLINTKGYTPRKSNVSEPHFMQWAQIDLKTGEYNPNARNRVKEQLTQNASRADGVGLEFERLGPDNVGGRTRAILEVYENPDKLIVGSISGGIFISYNGGANWEPHTQFQNLDSSSSIISAIHQDTVSGRIYVGTGCIFDADQEPWPGFGIFVSDDEGETFRHLKSTTPDNRFITNGDAWLYVNRIRTDGAGNVYAATGKGLKRSSDLGETWEDAIFIGSSFPTTEKFADVIATKSGRVVAATTLGKLYISQSGEAQTFEAVVQSGLPTDIGRTVLSHAYSNENHIYAMFINNRDASTPNSRCLNSIWESKDGGKKWASLAARYDGFTPMGNSVQCQGIYDAALAVSPIDENLFFVGGVQMWRYDGNLTRVSTEFGAPPFQDVLPNYIHADKHYAYFSPNDPTRLYVTSDGGVSVTKNNGSAWAGLNKGYTTTQFYSVAHTNEGEVVIGGTQDNGTLVVLGDNDSDPMVGCEITGGDGLECAVSQISDIIFTSVQRGGVYRTDAAQRNGSSFSTGTISPSQYDDAQFETKVALWENIDEPTSKDSIDFSAESTEVAIDVSNGVVKSYSAAVQPAQPEAIVIENSITVYAGSEVLIISANDNTVLEGSGNASGTVQHNNDGSFDVDVTFAQAPAENSNVYVTFDARYEANSILLIESRNLNSGLNGHTFEYQLEVDLNPGDVVRIQDPVQSLLASTGAVPENEKHGVRIYRNTLNFLETPNPIHIPGLPSTRFDETKSLAFTSNGNSLFIGMGDGRLFRVDGLQEFYTASDLHNLIVTSIAPVGLGGISGIAIDPNDDNRLVITSVGYNGFNNVHITQNALGSATFTNIHSNLASMPVYDVVIDKSNPDVIVVGTEFGVWATKDGGDSWTDENDQFGYVPTYSLKQQSLPWEEAKNSGTYFVGTFGRGLWKSTSLVGVEKISPLESHSNDIYGLKVFPNPMKDQGTISLESATKSTVDISIFDINGRKVHSSQEGVNSGTNQITINTLRLRSGTYYVQLISGESTEMAKIMVLK